MNKRLLYSAAIAILTLTSCEEIKMEWHRDPSYGEVTTSELPLGLAEKITRYQPLLAYLPNSEAKLGIGVGMDLYMNNPSYDSIIHSNFNDIAVGYAMKHGAMVTGTGECDFAGVDAFFNKATQNGLSVFGHCLIWHTNQNAGYLNNLIADVIVPDAGNLLDLNVLFDGSFTGWTMNGNISLAKGSGYGGGDALKLVSTETSSNYWDMQMVTPELTVDVTHNHEISFWVKSDTEGSARISFNGGITNRWPWKDWWNNGGSWTEAFTTNNGWQKVQIYLAPGDFSDKTFQVCFDFGKIPGTTYYIDINNMLIKDLDAEPANMISNGTFEDGTINPWGGWGNSSERFVSQEGEGYGDTGYCMVMVNPAPADAWSAQTKYTFDADLENKEYYVTWRAKCLSGAGKIQVELQNPSYSANYSGTRDVTTEWQTYEWIVTPDKGSQNGFLFDFGQVADTYYVDDVKIYLNPEASASPIKAASIVIPKTEAEKKEIITAAMDKWIADMVGHCKGTVHAWDVVNEPMDDNNPSEIKSGVGKELESSDFYWQDYLGKDYAVNAFVKAREAGNPDDKLFINDYNLESNPAKCDGLIEYVSYIESKGAKVDGIGTQMHVGISWTDTLMISEMFQKLAATGKLIKISELDVQLGTASPTEAQLAQQANMYRYIVENYFKIIPASQQYGITLWSVSDNPIEHEFWLPGDGPNVWNANYARKHAYKGVCDGLAGYDVSKDFPGDLQ